MDNYMSPEVAVKLRSMEIFSKATIRKERFGFPPGVCFTNERLSQERGVVV